MEETGRETMRASVLFGVGDVRTVQRPAPEPGPREVVVQVGAVGVCGSDTHYYLHGRIGPFVIDDPLILGHEASGTIVAVGADVDPSRIGTRVSIEPQKPCRRCEQCKAGRYNLCPQMEFFATPPVDGAFAERVVIEDDFAHEVPESVSDEAAALIEPLSVGLWTCDKAGVSPGSRVLVAGAGPIGVIIAQVARARGAAEVHISDVSADRLAFARTHGATHAHLADTDLTSLGADVFIDASGAPAAIRAGIRATAPAGRVVLVGLGADDVELPVNLLQNREISLTGVFRYANTWPVGIAMVADCQVDLDCLVSHRFGLADVEQALLATQDVASMKVLVTPQT